MIPQKLIIGLLALGFISCNSKQKPKNEKTFQDIKVVGAMKNVMWKGKLEGKIHLDTISNKNGLYGLGPVSFLTGEIVINNGKSYISKVTSDSTMQVEKSFNVSAPFFVYGNVTNWNEIELSSEIKSINDLEKFIEKKSSDYKRPFPFKLTGKVSNAIIHVQNLPKGTKVSSPDEAHQGQTNFTLNNEVVEIIGFYSTKHKGIFTHHDTNLHMHLINKDENKMGHLDKLEIENMKLFLPKK